MILRASAIAPLVLALGCMAALDRVNALGARDDVWPLLAAQGVTETPDCSMAPSSRSGACRVKLSPAQVKGLAKALGLAEVSAPSFDADLGGECPVASELHRGGVYRYWEAGNRPVSLALRGGGAFEYLVVHFDSSRHEACLHFSYAYG